MAEVYFSLGSNLGDRLNLLIHATKLIDKEIGKVEQYSSVVESVPWGFDAETTFYNQVLMVETDLFPQQVLAKVLEIEKSLGRLRSGSTYKSRIIDIDILFYGNEQVADANLIIPHPLLHKRRFVLEPLNTMVPDLLHPVLQETIAELLAQLTDTSLIRVAVEKDKFAGLLQTTNLC